MKKGSQGFEFQEFSKKQKKILNWWREGSPHKDDRMIVADGAIRSGKTIAMICSFLQWSTASFDDGVFIIAGRSIGALKRNVLSPMFSILRRWGWDYVYNRGDGKITIGTNVYHTFGASNEVSQDSLQGLTACGCLADEIALFPRSFTDQMIGRCSVKGSKIFMNCNPRGAYHYFKIDFIDRAKEMQMYYLHFIMDDNLTLSQEIRDSYYRSFTGVFFKQYILGLWVSAEGAIYPMWDDDANTYVEEDPEEQYQDMIRYVAIDYGTHNPMVFLDAFFDGDQFFIRNEYYWDSSTTQVQKTDSQYADDLMDFVGEDRDLQIIIDPSAASFIAELKNRGFRIKQADNDVRDGISVVATMIQQRRIRAERNRTKMLQSEVHSYVWDEKAKLRGVEQPLKEHDHAMDALRYLVKTLINRFRLMRGVTDGE